MALSSLIRLVVSFLILSTITNIVVYSFPSGAGGCIGGKAAVEDSHRSTEDGKRVRFLTFQQKQISVQFGRSNPFTLGTNVTTFKIPYTDPALVTVIARKSKGILIRFVPRFWPIVIQPLDNTQMADACSKPILGMCHKNNNLKNRYDGYIKLDDDDSTPNPKAVIIVDITVVYNNDDSLSSFAYKRFYLYPKVE
jgi:hypothetical protein